LAVIAEAELNRLGFGGVENLQLCTACEHDVEGERRFRSYRKGDRGAQQHAGLLISELIS
jgi:copper oxidase (laccase) domain-containing protein